jgi:hypothetical protein
MTKIETTIAPAPIAHHQRGHTNSAPAATRKRSAAKSHNTPENTETGWVSCGSSANPNALAKPSRCMEPWTTSTIAKTNVIARSEDGD